MHIKFHTTTNVANQQFKYKVQLIERSDGPIANPCGADGEKLAPRKLKDSSSASLLFLAF